MRHMRAFGHTHSPGRPTVPLEIVVFARGQRVGDPGECSGHLRDSSEKQRQIIGSEARVELTVEIDPAVCNATKAKLNARRKAVTHLTWQLRKAATGGRISN
jgi:hypothetical protein